MITIMAGCVWNECRRKEEIFVVRTKSGRSGGTRNGGIVSGRCHNGEGNEI